MPRITTFLTFNNQAEEAVNSYIAIFGSSTILSIMRYAPGGPGPEGSAMGITFMLEVQEFYALNGGPHFTFADGISLFVSCESQEEVDRLWGRISEGGEKGQRGWLKDRWGVSWQIIPTTLGALLNDSDPRKARNDMQAMLQMTKIDIGTLRRAYEQA